MTDLLRPPHTLDQQWGPRQRPLPDIPHGCREVRPPPGSRYERLAEIASPISPAGFFEYDRRIKDGSLLKRTKRTKSWKTTYLVLRPQYLSLYKDPEETQLRHKIKLTDISAVAMRKDRKRKGEHEGVFGLYTPWRTFHFEARSYASARSWVDTLRREAKVDEELDPTDSSMAREQNRGRLPISAQRDSVDRESSSSPDRLPGNMHRLDRPQSTLMRSSSTIFEFSGPESYSDFSDAPGFSSGTEGQSPDSKRPQSAYPPIIARDHFYEQNPSAVRKPPVTVLNPKDEARTITHGNLLCLKTRTGVKQWKRYWIVLRPKHIAFYKDREEYSASQIIPIEDIVDAVEIDSISKKRNFCMQLIMEDRSYRFCAPNEDDLMRWLGSIKYLLSKRKNPTDDSVRATKAS